jgi:hypothetical protein
MKLDRIYKIVAFEVDATMPSQIVRSLAKEIKQDMPEDREEVLDLLECIDDESSDMDGGMDDGDGDNQDDEFRGLCEEEL